MRLMMSFRTTGVRHVCHSCISGGWWVIQRHRDVTNQVFRVGRGFCNNLFEAAAESPPVSSHTVCGLNALQVRKDEFVACCKTPQRRCLIYVTYILYRLLNIFKAFSLSLNHILRMYKVVQCSVSNLGLTDWLNIFNKYQKIFIISCPTFLKTSVFLTAPCWPISLQTDFWFIAKHYQNHVLVLHRFQKWVCGSIYQYDLSSFFFK